MEDKYNIDDIENFLNQEMDAESLAAFEKEMATDKALAAEVSLHEDVIKGIKRAGASDFRNLVAGVHQDLQQEGFFTEEQATENTGKGEVKTAKVRQISFVRGLAIAASFALLLTVGWWMFSQPVSPDQLFANNFSVHQDVLSIEIEDRLAETGFGTNKEALTNLQAAINTYNQGDYTEAIDQFNTFQAVAPADGLVVYAKFYEAVALLKMEQIAPAIEELATIVSTDFPLQSEAKWYLALAYLKQGNLTDAKLLLQTLSQVDAYADKASELLKNL